MWDIDKKGNEAAVDKHEPAYNPQEKTITFRNENVRNGKNMNYKLWFDEKNRVARILLLRALKKDEAEQMMSEAKQLIAEHKARKGIMDLSKAISSSISKETRQVYREHFGSFTLNKLAVIVTSPIIRMFAKAALSSLGEIGITKFFKTEAQALAWLEEDTKQ
jgi:hypothetical protein